MQRLEPSTPTSVAAAPTFPEGQGEASVGEAFPVYRKHAALAFEIVLQSNRAHMHVYPTHRQAPAFLSCVSRSATSRKTNPRTHDTLRKTRCAAR